jgi:lipopolysaccharide export system permease protein
MLKKLDKLVLKAFFPPFLLTFFVVIFILLTQFMLKYFDDFVGKNLSYSTYAELLFFFSINSVPLALPISILLSSIMTYGNLSEHNELTAIKSAGISLVRIIQPVFFVVCLLTMLAFLFNDRVLPYANLRAYSLLYDITTKKAAFNIKEGTFYYGLPGFAVKINHKEPDGSTIRQVMIYNHQDDRGNVNLTIADSGKMYTIWNDRYLILELFRGDNYTEMLPKSPGQESEFTHNHFDYSKLVFNLSSFEMSRTDIQLFASNKIMRNISELHRDIDSVKREGENLRKFAPANFLTYFSHFMRQRQAPLMQENQLDSLSNRLRERWERDSLQWIQSARNQIQSIKNYTEANKDRLKNFYRDSDVFEVEILKKYTQAIACLIMFLLGAPLGAIIRKGGFGVPVLISIFFFIIYYVLSITGEKWSKEDLVEVSVGMWATNFLLFWAGLYFLAKARSDSSLLDNNYFTQFFSFIGRLIRQMFSGKKSKEISS